ncbi:MAG: T9SS type A sorting domain-containing protein [Chitinophagales bacterium]|nr:T9SS type A sorting domain-containing protein [Chitinophagales bacterium]
MRTHVLEIWKALRTSAVVVMLPLSTWAQGGGAVWEYGPVMNQTRIYAYTAALDDGRQIVFGGRESGFISCSYADVFNYESNSFTAFEMNYPRDAAAVVKMNDGRFFLAGGGYDYGIAPGYQDAEVFDPADNTFSYVGELFIPRMQCAGAQLADGRVLIAGGWYNPDGAAVAELFTPSMSLFSMTGSMNTPRAAPVVLPCNDGGALVFGGWPTYGGDLYTSVEYYDAVNNTFSEFSSELIPEDPGWLVHSSTESRPIQEKVMFDGRYLFKAYRNTPVFEWALIAFDPDTKTFERISLDAGLTDGPPEGFYDLVLDAGGHMAYLLGYTYETLPYPVCLVTVDLHTGHVYMPEASFALGANEWIMGHMSWNRVTEKILFTGISFSGSDYFNASDLTYLITPDYRYTVGLDDTPLWQLAVYPNPATDQIHVVLPGEGAWMLTLVDMTGNIILQESCSGSQEYRIDAGNWPAGMYLLNAALEGQQQTIKLQLIR